MACQSVCLNDSLNVKLSLFWILPEGGDIDDSSPYIYATTLGPKATRYPRTALLAGSPN